MVEAFNREVQGLDDVELWIHTCWGNPNMQRVIEDDSYKASFDLYLGALKGDVWTVEMTDRQFREIELFGSMKGRLPKKIAVGVVSHRTLQVDRPEDVAARIRRALEHISPEQLIVSSDCGFGRQGQPGHRVLQVVVDRAGGQYRPPRAGPAGDPRRGRRPDAADRHRPEGPSRVAPGVTW